MKTIARGFTIIELMIGLVVISILAFVGLPEFSIMMANTKVRTAAEAITNGLQTARGEAVQRNGTVQFILGAQSSYTVVVVSTGEVLRSRPASEGSSSAAVAVTPPTTSTVTFNSFGRVVANPDGTASLTQVDVTSNTNVNVASKTRSMRVIVANTVRMCDPQVAVKVAVDPRSCI